jgi:hypothetical protein
MCTKVLHGRDGREDGPEEKANRIYALLGKSTLGVSYSGIMDARNEQGLLHCQHFTITGT